jgi:hypothetical protein
MANLRNLGEASRLITFGQGTFINGATGGTVNGAELGKFEYHSVIFAGTFANNGTINVYAATSASGSSPQIIRSLALGSSDNPWACIDVKSSAMGSLNSAQGSTYTHLGVYGTVESGGTWRGALFILSTSPRQQVPGTTGLGTSAGGTSYYGTYLT